MHYLIIKLHKNGWVYKNDCIIYVGHNGKEEFVVYKSWQKIKANYEWVIISLCFIMIFVCLGFCSSNRSLYLSPITEALGFKRSHFSIGDSIRFVSTSVVNIFFGTLVAKFGTKKLITSGFICLIISCLIYSFADKLIWFYISGAFLGIGFSWTTTTMVGCVVNKWCKEKKGTIMGAVLASNGIGAALATQILSPIIYEEGNKFGYRDAYLLTTLILTATLVLILVLYKDKPKTPPPHKLSEQKSAGKKANEWNGIDITLVKKNMYFYLTALCIFFTGMVLQGITGIAAAHMKDVMISPDFVATVLSIHSLSLAASKFVIGFLYDKFGLRLTGTICYVAAILAMIGLAFLSDSAIGTVLTILYAFLAALALPLETIMIPIFANDLFGLR